MKNKFRGTLTKIAESKDDFDNFIINQLSQEFGSHLVNGLLLEKKEKEALFGAIFNCSMALLKANKARRDYLEEEQKAIEHFKKRVKKDTNPEIILGDQPIELLSNADAFFIQLKSGLDHLGQVITPLTGIKVDGWHKGDYNGRKGISGARILSALKNLPSKDKEKFIQLIDLIEKNIKWITYLVTIRDNPLHKKAYPDNIIPMKIRRSEKIYFWKIRRIVSSCFQPLSIKHLDGTAEELGKFLTTTLHDILGFIEAFLFSSLKAKAIKGIKLVVIEPPTRDGRKFSWAFEKKPKSD